VKERIPIDQQGHVARPEYGIGRGAIGKGNDVAEGGFLLVAVTRQGDADCAGYRLQQAGAVSAVRCTPPPEVGCAVEESTGDVYRCRRERAIDRPTVLAPDVE